MSLTSVTWPKSLLCAANRKLVAKVDELTTALTQKHQSCEEAKDAVALMKENTVQARKMIAFAEKELAAERQASEKAASEARIMRLENEKIAEELARWEGEAVRLRSLTKSSAEALTSAHEALATEINLAAYHEDAAKEAVEARLAREKKGEALETEMARFSSQVWSRLSRLNEVVARRRLELQSAREELAHALKELDGVRQSLRAAVQDQQGSVQELARIQAECNTTDNLIRVNGESMQALQEKAATKRSLKAKLEKALASLNLDAKVALKSSESKRAIYDEKMNELRRCIEGLKQQAELLESVQRQQKAEGQHNHGLLASFENTNILVEERRASVQQHRDYRQQLQELIKAMERDAITNPVPSPEAMLAMHSTLQGQLSRWEDRLERAQERVTAAISEMVMEGRKGDAVQERLGVTHKAAAKLSEEYDNGVTALRSTSEKARALSDELAKKQELLPELRAASLLQHDQRRRQCEATIGLLRERLSEATNVYRHLLQANTSLRGNLRRTKETLEEQSDLLSRQAEDDALLLNEMPSLERELELLEQRYRELVETNARAQVTFAALKAAADGQVNAMKEAAGTEAILRAEMVAQESTLEADMQSALVELHLHQAALREQGEELRRQARRRDLLRARYEELMQSLTRAVAAPLATEEEAADTRKIGTRGQAHPLPSLAPLDETAAPEALHARLLLQRSYERERLMEKGNYLDLRLVALDRETATLRRMRETMSQDSTKQHEQRASAADAPSMRETLKLQHANPNASDAVISLAKDSSDERARLMKAELDLQEATLSAMHEQSELSRAQLKSMRKTLQELQNVEKQKRLQLQRLQEQVHRARQKSIQQDYKRLKGKAVTKTAPTH